MIILTQPPENMNFCREACSIDGTPAVTLFLEIPGLMADNVCLTSHDLWISETK